MAQLKDLLVSGPSRLIGKLFANEVQLTTLNIPTASNGTTYGPGTSGQALVTNGTSAYWKTITIADIGGSDVLGVAKGGTGNTVATQGGIVYGNGTTYALTAAGSSGQVLQSAGTGTPTWITATNSNTASTIVKRDASGNFSAGTITATLSGNASSATKLGSSNVGSSTQPIYLEGGTPKAATAYSAAAVLSASKFTAAQSITLTGDVTGTASSVAGWSIATTLATQSGVTGGSYGLSADASPAHGGKFKVPYVTVNTKGLVTGIAEKEITLPTDNNTDVNVSQTITTGNSDYRILFSGTADDTTRTEGSRKGTNLRYNPSTSELKMVNGTLWVQGGSNAGSSSATNRLTLTSGMPANLAYNTSKRGTRIYSNGIAFADPYKGNSNNDSGWIRHIEETANSGVLEIGTGDDSNESIVVRQYNTSSAVASEITLLNASHQTLLNTTLPRANNTYDLGSSSVKWKTVYAATFDGTATNATTAAKLGTNAGSTTQPVYFTNGIPTAITGNIANGTTGNAATATKFASSQTIKLTGDVTGTASSQAGWSIATTLANSGVTAASYGPAANASPAHGGNFTVPYITVDAKGRITAASSKTITLPSSNFVKSGSTAAAGLVPSPGTTAGVERYLNEDGTWKKVYESFLSWGGKNFSASYGPIDAAMIDPLGANRFAFLKAAGLTIEYSTDGGSNWIDYGATNAQKVGLFSNGYGFYLGKHTSNGRSTVNDQLRVTIDTGAAQIYTVLNKIVIYMSTSGNTVQVKIEKALQRTPTTYSTHLDWTGISGWSGWNILNINDITTYGNTAGSQYGRIRFTFKQSAVNSGSYPAAVISRIMGFGGMGWTVPSNMARDGHLYSYDSDQNATFPATVTATSFVGNASSATTATTANKLGTNAGSSSQPVYFSGGIPVAITGALGNDITGNAATSTKLGTADVGSTYVPIHLVAGTATQCSSPSLQVNLASTNADTVFKQSPRPGVTGVLGLANGGTGQTSAANVFSALSWTDGTTAGPTLSATIVGQTRTATIPSASATASGVVTTGTQTFRGRKQFGYLDFFGRSDSGGAVQYVGDIYYKNNAGTQVAEIWYDTGNATNITKGQFYWREFSPNSTANTATTGHHETYSLPAVTAGLTENKSYSILTTKSTLTVAQGGTGQTTAAGIFNVVRDNGGNSTWVNVSGDTMTGTLTIKGLKATSGTDYGTTLPTSGTEGQVFFQISDEQYEIPVGGNTGALLMKASATDRDVTWTPSAIHVTGSVLYGAAWNDYAEYRKTETKIEAGRVVIENGNDTLSLSTERMQPGAEIVSDTFGFAIGQTKNTQTPIAVSGRVLAYPNEPRESYKPGQPVCSGPNGTVSQMTNEEAREYPWLIIGTVSAIPDYDTWGEDNIKINGRIWIRIR